MSRTRPLPTALAPARWEYRSGWLALKTFDVEACSLGQEGWELAGCWSRNEYMDIPGSGWGAVAGVFCLWKRPVRLEGTGV